MTQIKRALVYVGAALLMVTELCCGRGGGMPCPQRPGAIDQRSGGGDQQKCEQPR